MRRISFRTERRQVFRKALFAYIPFATCLLVEFGDHSCRKNTSVKGRCTCVIREKVREKPSEMGLGSGCDRLRMLQAKLVIRASIQVDQYVFDHGVFPVIALAEWQLLVLLPSYSLESTRGWSRTCVDLAQLMLAVRPNQPTYRTVYQRGWLRSAPAPLCLTVV